MSWNIRYLDEVDDDFKKLDGSQTIKVRKAIKRTLTNPLPHSEGGYGIELGHKGGINLANCLEIKLRGKASESSTSSYALTPKCSSSS